MPSIEAVVGCVVALGRLLASPYTHIGAFNATARLPITTMYADLASAVAARQHLPPTNKLRDKIGFI